MLVRMKRARYEEGLTERGSYLLYVGTYSGTTVLRLLEDGSTQDGRPGRCSRSTNLSSSKPVTASSSGTRAARWSSVAGSCSIPILLVADATRWSLGHDLIAALEEGPDAVASVMLNHRRRGSLADLVGPLGRRNPRRGSDGRRCRRLRRRSRTARPGGRSASRNVSRGQPPRKGNGLGQLALALDLDTGHGSGDRRRPHRSRDCPARSSRPEAPVEDEIDSDPRWSQAKTCPGNLPDDPPPIRELGLDGELLRVLVRSGRLVRVSDDLVYLPEEAARMVEVMRSMEGPFSVSEFRQKAGISRKHAVPFLEYTDRES